MKITENSQPDKKILFRAIICLLILVAGIAGKNLLASLKKPPAQAKPTEPSLKVEILSAEKKDYPVTISGYGELQSRNVVPIAAEVSGRIIQIHPRLEPGEIIPAGEILFQIDDRDYQIAVETGRRRLAVLKRNLELEEKEFQRVRRLYRENNVGTASGVDTAEKILLNARDRVLQVQQALDLATHNLNRCTVKSPFPARIQQVTVETGQFVAPGQNLVTLVDDSALEIHVPIDSRDARKWLRFDSDTPQDENRQWFSGIQPVDCQIQWTEAPHTPPWKGQVHRIVAFQPQSRTLTLAVRLRNRPQETQNDRFPLVQGMFCRVSIPGKTMQNVVRLPQWSVSFENTAYVAVKDRLKTVSVTVERMEGDDVYVSQGIESGDRVIITRLINPLENSLLTITNL